MGCDADRRGDRKGARDSDPFILSAADYAEHKPGIGAPRELEIHDSLIEYGTLYHAGGWADQPYSLMRRIQAAHNVYAAWRRFKQSKDWNALQRDEPDTWRIIERVLMLRKEQERSG